MDRAAQIAALRRERRHVAERFGDTARVAQIDTELARFDEKPVTVRRETAVPGNIRRNR